MGILKRRTEAALKRAGVYHRLKTSWIDDLYRELANRSSVRARREQIDFYRRLLPALRSGDLIFDIGANEGLKTDLFLRMGARVVAVEPDEINQFILQERFLKLRIIRKPVAIVKKAVSDTNGVESMWIDGPGSAVNTLSGKWALSLRGNKARHTCGHCGLDFVKHKTVETTSLQDLIDMYGRPVFIKIDVEGYELNVLRGLRQPIACLSFEVNLPEFRPEGLECIRCLSSLAPSTEFNYSADCRRGFALQRWLGADEFANLLDSCDEPSIEVFCRMATGGLVAGSRRGHSLGTQHFPKAPDSNPYS